MSGRIKLAVLGGSALATPKLFEALGRLRAQAPYDVVLIGRDPARLELVARISRELLRSFPEADVRISTSVEAERALEGADYVLNQMRIGGLEGRAFDETFPRQFGIPGEETVGPGGFNNALRTIPVVLEYCRLIRRVTPTAVVINLTNPSSLVQYAIRRYAGLQVVGTCDSPVSLMETVARVLGVPAGELEFDMAGMHHFGWISAVRHDGRDRLGEVLERLGEMPKLEVDAELVRALGVIPSFYFRYYAHPDRVLAATEGRPVRAQQLMALTAEMLADYERWRPGGTLPATLSQRGAVWYDKIVAPTLVALAEKRDAEYVLSVDNHGALPWLPDEAIVEVPVPIRRGGLEKPRGAELPVDVRGLIHRNCAYEMLAVEAIVEQDWAKAHRALLSNLLVTSYNQARGILNLIWPERKLQVNVVVPPEKQKPSGYLKVPRLHYGERLLESSVIPEEDYALVTMEEPWELAKGRLPRPPAAVVFVRHMDWYQIEAVERALPAVDAVVGLGGGTAIDAAKFIGWRRHIPVDEIPSIVSVDACVTKSVAVRAGGHVTYIGHVVPRNVLVDYTLVQGAPPRLNRSGVGDILCAHTALWDWRLAHEQTGEAYDEGAAAAVQGWLDQIPRQATHVSRVDPEGIRFIVDAFADISIICRRFGSSRPQEASEHTFAYNAEFQTGKQFLHGELVALGAYVIATLQGNAPDYLRRLYQETGLLWQPADIGLNRDEFILTLRTLNWYQKNFGRRYSVLDVRAIDEAFIEGLLAALTFS